jgi:hypothetical protein
MMKILVNVVPMMTLGFHGFDKNCTQLVTTGTHVISDSEIDNSSDEQEQENKHIIGRGVQ